jgi:hypothetical protein
MAMKRSILGILGILCFFLLSGCIFDPVFDTSSWEAYQTSSSAIKAKLSNDDLRRLEIALKYLLTEGAPQIEGQLAIDVAGRIYPNTRLILARLGPRIGGKSAAAVIQDLTIKLDAETSEVETRMQNASKVLAAVEVDSPNYYWRGNGYFERPVIEFSVFNAGKVPITRVYFSGVLISPNRSIPWVKQGFVRTFMGGLEPREKQHLTLEPRASDWNDRQLKDLSNAELKVVVTNFEDVNGERAVAIDTESLDAKRKVRAALQ